MVNALPKVVGFLRALQFPPTGQGRQSIPKSEGDGLQIRKVRRYAIRNFFGTLKRHFQRFEGTYKVIVQCA